MNKFISLLKVDLVNTLEFIKPREKKDSKRVIFFLLLFIILVPNYIIMIKGLASNFQIYKSINKEADFLISGAMNAQLISLIFGFAYIITKYYYSNDLEYLVPLPIKSSYIVGSKFVMTIIYNYLIVLPIFFPYLLIYSKNIQTGFLFMIYGLVGILTISILPMAFLSIIIMLMMKYTNIGAKKEIIRNIFFVLFIASVFYLQIKIQRLIRIDDGSSINFLESLAYGNIKLIEKIGIYFPTAFLLGNVLSNSSKLIGLVNIFIYLFINLLSYLLVLLIAEKTYISGYISIGEVASRKLKSLEELKDKIKVDRPSIAIMKKEIKTIIKTPIYLVNMLAGAIIVPMMGIIPLYTNLQGQEDLLTYYLENKLSFIIYVALLISFLNMNSPSATTFSREGRTIWLHRIMPIRAEDQVRGRVGASLILIGFINLVGYIVLLYFLPISILELLAILIISLLVSLPLCLFMIYVDASRPVLNWVNPQKAIKQNMNVLISMMVTSIHLLTMAFLVYLFKDNPSYILVILLVFSLFISYLLNKLAIKTIEKNIYKLD